MATRKNGPQPCKRSLGTPYCYDPTCKSCKELRDAYERVSEDEQFRANFSRQAQQPVSNSVEDLLIQR
jgi:hypothetical protein